MIFGPTGASTAFLLLQPIPFVNICADALLLNFSAFKRSRNGKCIAVGIERTVNDFKLSGKLEFVVTDNASNMRKALDLLKEVMVVDKNEEKSGKADSHFL